MLKLGCGALAALSLCTASPAVAGTDDWNTASNIGRDALVISAFALPAIHRDWTGAKQAAFSLGSAQLVTLGLKSTIDEERPDGSDDRSFPSGHTSISFAAAATIGKRYGWEYGLPAHAVAVFVGVARVKADKHFVHDVIVGAVIGEASGWIFTRPKDSNVHFLPWGSAHGGGAQVIVAF